MSQHFASIWKRARRQHLWEAAQYNVIGRSCCLSQSKCANLLHFLLVTESQSGLEENFLLLVFCFSSNEGTLLSSNKSCSHQFAVDCV